MNSDDIIWVNGDVVFNESIIDKIVNEKGNICCVQYKKVSEEEIKFTLDEKGYISKLNKKITNGLGEAVGINKISKESLEIFIKMLEECGDKDYFEKAIELGYSNNLLFKPLDITKEKCIEIDFIEDLHKAWEIFK